MTKTESADSAILAEQVRQWTQERDRLQDLIDVASGTEFRLAATTQASTAQAEQTDISRRLRDCIALTLHDQAPDDEPDRQQANTDFVAAFSPPTALALIALARATPQHPDQWKYFVDKAVDVLQRHTPPDGLSDSDALAELYGIFDGPEFHKMGTVPQIQCDMRQAQAMAETKHAAMLSAAGAATPQHSVTDQERHKLAVATDWISKAAHGEDCFVSDHYDGDPGDRCNCGLESLQEWLESDAQPLASTAATQPEQASELEMFKEWLAKRDPRTFQPDAYWDHGYKWSAWQARAALAIPASTAPVQPEPIQMCETCDDPAMRMPDGSFGICQACVDFANAADAEATQPFAEVARIAIEQVVEDLRPAMEIFKASTAASEQASVSELPLLPEPFGTMENADEDGHTIGWIQGYTADQMRGYAIDALSGRATIPSDAASEQQAGADERTQNILESCARWLAGHAKTTWARDFEHTGLMNRYADRLLEIRATLTHRATTAPGYKLVPVKITPEMIESGLAAHYGKRRLAAAGGAGGIDMTVNDVNYSGTQAMRNFWRGALAAAPGTATTAADQQGAAQAQAGDARDAARYRFVKSMSKETLLVWRGMYGCTDEAVDAAMAAPATSGGGNG